MRVSFFRQVEQFVKRQAFRLRFQLAVVAQGSVTGSKDLPASVLFTSATRTSGVDRNMPELARHPVLAGDNLSVCQDACSDSFRNRDQYRVANAIHSSKPELGHEAGGGSILHLRGQPHPALDDLLDIVFRPLQIGSKDKAMRFLINPPGNADTNSLQRLFGIAVPDSLHAVNQAGN